MKFINISEENRNSVSNFIMKHWYSTDMVVRGKIIDMIRVYFNALDIARKLKPSIPMIGDFGIPIKHEIEFELKLK